MTRMWQEYQSPAFGQISLLGHLLHILLIQLERTRQKGLEEQPPLTEHAQIYQSFLSALEQHYKQQHKVSAYARHLYITSRELSTITHR